MSEPMEGENESQPVSQKRTSGNSADCASPKKSQRFGEPPKTTTDSCVAFGAGKPVVPPPGDYWASQTESKSLSFDSGFGSGITNPSGSKLTPLSLESGFESEITKPCGSKDGSVSESDFCLVGSTTDDNEDITDSSVSRPLQTLSSATEPANLSPKTDGVGSAPKPSSAISKTPDPSPKTDDGGVRSGSSETTSVVAEPIDFSFKTGNDGRKPGQIETATTEPKEISPRTGGSGQTILYSIDIPSPSKQTTVKGSHALYSLQTVQVSCAASSSNEGKTETRTKEIIENIPGTQEDKMIDTSLDSRTMGTIAKNIGKEWSEIATYLGFSVAQQDHLREMYRDSLYDRNLCMINSWLKAVEEKGIANPRRLLAHCIANVNAELATNIDTNFREAVVPQDLDSIIQEIIIGKHLQQTDQKEEVQQTNQQYQGDVQDQLRCTYESWEDLDQYVYETKACKQAIFLLKSEGIVTLIGPAGEGKSFISHHIALKYMKENGYTIIPVSSIKEIEDQCDPRRKQIFVLDDPLGSLCLEKTNLSEWVTKNDKIKNIAKKGLTKFIATIRTSIYQKAGRSIKRTIFSKPCVDLTSEPYKLGEEERQNILKRHCTHATEDQDKFKKVTGSYFPGFPLLCHLLRIDSKSQEEMGNDLDPFKLMLHQIQEIEEKEQLCALVLTAMFDGVFDPQDLDLLSDENDENEIVKKSKKIIKLCGLNPNDVEKLDAIKKSFDHLKSVYFVEKESEFYFLHDVIYSVVAYHFGQSHLAFILEWCSSTFIQERVRVKDPNTKEAYDGTKPIEIPEKKFPDFAKRLTKDLTDEKHVNVFQNPSIHHIKFQDVWVKHLLNTYNRDKLWEIMSFIKEIEADAELLQNLKKTLDFAILSSTPIHWLCKYGMLSMLKKILAKYTNPNKMLDDLPGHTKPLHFAAGCGHLDLVQYLLELGQDVNSKSSLKIEEIDQTSVAEYYTGFTPLFYAARENHLEVVEFLLKNHAEPNLVREHGASPMLLTADRGHAKVVQMLIEHGGNPDLCCDHGTSPLILAASENHVETVEVLLKKDVDVNRQKFENGVSAVFFAASRGHYESLELLLNKKANPNLCDIKGLSPLGVALQGGYLKSAELLISHGANIETCDKNRNSALLLTVKRKYSECSKNENDQNSTNDFIKLLLGKGAKCDAQNTENQSPLSVAEDHNDAELVQLLKA